MNLQAGKNRLKGKTRHQRVPVSCALLAARGSQIPPQLAISGRLLCSSSAKQQISPSMFPTLRKPVHCSKHNPPLAELPSFTLGLDLLTSCIVYTRCPFCLFIHKPAPGRQASCFLTPALFAFSAIQLWFMYGLHQGNSCISIGIEGVYTKTRALGCNLQWLPYALNKH